MAVTSVDSIDAKLAAQHEALGAEFPEVRLVAKATSTFMRIIDIALRILSLGKNTEFLTNYVTTIGSTIYLPLDWISWPASSRLAILRHETVHLRQQRRYGALLFGALYLFFPVPMFFAWARYRFERDAYAESIKCTVELFGPPTREYRDFVVSQFTGSAYLWTWVKRSQVEAWFDSVVVEALQ